MEHAGSRRHLPSITRWVEHALGRLRVPHGIVHLVAGSLVVALFLASLSIVLDEVASAAVWLDFPAFRFSGLGRQDPEPEILTLTIRTELFETMFRGETPIPREPFRTLVSDVVETFAPAVLAVDYDLSPGKDELTAGQLAALREGRDDPLGCARGAPGGGTPRTGLDCSLASLGGRLLLIRPLPVADRAQCEPRVVWQRWMEGQGVAFGAPDLVMLGSFSAILKYETGRPESLAALAYCKGLAGPERPAACGAAPSAHAAESCETFADLKSRPVRKASLQTLNFPGADKGVSRCALERPESIRACAAIYRGRRFPVVFLGADYDWGDHFNTPMGVKPGVTLHAYSAYSMKKPLTAGHHWDFLVDVVVGVAAGIFFHWSWGHFSLYGMAKRLRRALLSLGGLVVSFGSVVWAVPWLFGLWTNPGLTLAGLFVKSWHTSVHQAGVAERRTPRAADRRVAWVYCAGWTAALVWALFIIVKHLIHHEPSGSH